MCTAAAPPLLGGRRGRHRGVEVPVKEEFSLAVPLVSTLARESLHHVRWRVSLVVARLCFEVLRSWSSSFFLAVSLS